MVLGKSSSKTRGWISAESWFAASSLTMRVLSRMESGVSRSEAIPRHAHAQGCKQQHRRDHLAAGDARGAHGRDLAIAGHPAQPDQDAHQHAERNGQRQHRRQRQPNSFRMVLTAALPLPTSNSNSLSTPAGER